MPGFLLHQGATVLCAHGGQARPMGANPRVKVAGQPVATQPGPYSVVGCPKDTPCATAQWITAATRVRAGGQPVLLQDSQAVCAPNGTGVTVTLTQTRVRGQ
jgi:uncharacterized Zn-binding protein involved in type VI secretion